MASNIKYFKVVAKCGHVGKRNYIPVAFAVKAESKSKASQKVKTFPNGIKYQKTRNKVTTFLYEDILTENDKKYFENQLNELEKLITKNNLE